MFPLQAVNRTTNKHSRSSTTMGARPEPDREPTTSGLFRDPPPVNHEVPDPLPTETDRTTTTTLALLLV